MNTHQTLIHPHQRELSVRSKRCGQRRSLKKHTISCDTLVTCWISNQVRHVLFVPSEGSITALTLANEFDCQVTVLVNPGDEPIVHPAHDHITIQAGSLDALPFEARAFDVAIVTIPLAAGLQRTANELARVLKHSGRLGVVALSLYQDQLSDEQGVVANTWVSRRHRFVLPPRTVLCWVKQDLPHF